MSDIADYAPNSGRVLKEDSTVINLANISSQTICGEGSVALIGTSAISIPSGYYVFKIEPSSAMTFTIATNSQTNSADLTSIASHPVGTPIYGVFTAITLATGDGIGYLAKS